jgi:hypothetical protein
MPAGSEQGAAARLDGMHPRARHRRPPRRTTDPRARAQDAPAGAISAGRAATLARVCHDADASSLALLSRCGPPGRSAVRGPAPAYKIRSGGRVSLPHAQRARAASATLSPPGSSLTRPVSLSGQLAVPQRV